MVGPARRARDLHGSGKSLAFWLPALTAVRADAAARVLDPGRIESVARRGAVLYLSPTKALAADQLSGLQRLLDAAGTRDVRSRRATATPRRTSAGGCGARRRRPDEPGLPALRAPAAPPRLDAAAAGPAVRRRGRGARLPGCSARTSPRPAAPAAARRALRARGRPASDVRRRVGDDRRPRHERGTARRGRARRRRDRRARHLPAGRKTFALWEPPVVVGFEASADAGPAEGHDDDPAVATPAEGPEHPRRSVTAETADLLADLVIAGARTLAFTRSRRGAESVAVQTQDSVRVVDPRLVRRVAAYRGGYLPEERRELETRCAPATCWASRRPTPSSWASTSRGSTPCSSRAGPAPACRCGSRRAAPGGREPTASSRSSRARTRSTRSSCTTRGGVRRAARGDRVRPSEPLRPRAAPVRGGGRVPLRSEDLAAFGAPDVVRGLLDVLVARGALRRRASGWYWTHAQPASGMTDLRGSGARPSGSPRRAPAGCSAPSTPPPRTDRCTTARCTSTRAAPTSSSTSTSRTTSRSCAGRTSTTARGPGRPRPSRSSTSPRTGTSRRAATSSSGAGARSAGATARSTCAPRW